MLQYVLFEQREHPIVWRVVQEGADGSRQGDGMEKERTPPPSSNLSHHYHHKKKETIS